MTQFHITALRADVRGIRVAPNSVSFFGGRRRGLVRLAGDETPFYAETDDGLDASAVVVESRLAEVHGLTLGSQLAVTICPWSWATRLELAPLAPLPPETTDDDLRAALDRLALTVGRTLTTRLRGSVVRLTVVGAAPAGWLLVTPSTHIELARLTAEPSSRPRGYGAVGGLSSQLALVRELVELPLTRPDAFAHFGIEPPRGLLLYGPPGTGKTLIARAVAAETDAWFAALSGPEVIGKYYGESEERLRDLFDQARANAPSVVFIDEIDAIAPRRSDMGTEKQVERRVVSQLLTLMDGLTARSQVVVMAATNIPDAVDGALRRPGRFDREIEIPVPDAAARREILQIHCQSVPLAHNVDLDELARRAHGFVGADLSALVREAVMAALRRAVGLEDLSNQQVTTSDFDGALNRLAPSATRGLRVEIQPVDWSEIGGLSDAKARLKSALSWAFGRNDELRRLGGRPPRGVMLCGPSGTGKTLLARAVAGERGFNFLAVNGPSLLAHGLGDTERALRDVFAAARRASPSVLFFDEIDALLPPRGRRGDGATGQFLAEMGGLTEAAGLLVLGATNRPEALDAALFAPGRFDWRIDLTLPDRVDRTEIFQVCLARVTAADRPASPHLAALTEGRTGADLRRLCDDALMAALDEGREPLRLELRHFDLNIPGAPPR